MEIHRKRLTLTFDFPVTAQKQYAGMIEALIQQTGWDVHVNPATNQQALGVAVDEVLPPGARILKGPSFYMNQGEVVVEVAGVADTGALAESYRALTGFRLRVGGDTTAAGDVRGPGDAPLPAASLQGGAQMEINAAYGVIHAALDGLGLYRAGLKQGAIMLTFISPQVGERHHELIQHLSEETGYAMRIHPHPNQQQILQIASQLAREAGWKVIKGPGIHVDRAAVSMKLAETPDAVTLAQVQTAMLDRTGYALVAEG
jgi:hypothetical protein